MAVCGVGQGGLSGEAAQKPRLPAQTHGLSRGGDPVTDTCYFPDVSRLPT